jgi:hypothetical protein
MSNYPDWVNSYKTKGTSIKKVGNNYYLYKTTSRRVPGKKYPQAVSEYIGIITEDGVKETGKKVVESEDVVVREYGLTTVVLRLLEDKDSRYAKGGKDRALLLRLLSVESPESYILDEEEVDYTIKEQAVIPRFREKIEALIGTTFRELSSLRRVYLVKMGKKAFVSRRDEEQTELLEKLGVSL